MYRIFSPENYHLLTEDRTRWVIETARLSIKLYLDYTIIKMQFLGAVFLRPVFIAKIENERARSYTILYITLNRLVALVRRLMDHSFSLDSEDKH